MKKALIAGAASLAVAAMPVAGVFAAGMTQTDTLNVTIDKACSISAVSHNPGDENSGDWSSDILSDTLAAKTYDVDFGSTDFTIVCNNTDGWKVTATAEEALTSSDGNTLPLLFATIANANKSGYTVTTESNSGLDSIGIMTQASQIVAQSSATTPEAGVSFTARYGVAVADGQAAGTYEGTVAYLLEEL